VPRQCPWRKPDTATRPCQYLTTPSMRLSLWLGRDCYEMALLSGLWPGAVSCGGSAPLLI
jgi:hypothetical protein